MWSLLLLALANAAAGATWQIDATVHGAGSPDAPGLTMASASFALNCDVEEATPRWEAWRCTLQGNTARVGKRAEDAWASLDIAVPHDVWFELRWGTDGRLKRVRPHGPEPSGLADWISLGAASLAVPSAPRGGEDLLTWPHRDPALLVVAGSARAVAGSGTLSVTVRSEDGSRTLAFHGSGLLDASGVIAMTQGASKEPVRLRVTGDAHLDASGDLLERTLDYQLHSTASGTQVGSQRVSVRRTTP